MTTRRQDEKTTVHPRPGREPLFALARALARIAAAEDLKNATRDSDTPPPPDRHRS